MAHPSKVFADGFEWIPRCGGLWADYDTAAAYQGSASRNAFRNYICRHRLRTIQHGQNKLVCKADLDRLAGLTDE